MRLDLLKDKGFYPDGLAARTSEMAEFLKALGHEGRLSVLCHLASGPKSVSELETLLDTRQAVVSQNLARLRLGKFVKTRREGKTIYYSIRDRRVRDMLLLLDRLAREDGKTGA